ncbi:MAG: 6-phosphofructokinase [Candidatus Margulisiibacteriota bacterium]
MSPVTSICKNSRYLNRLAQRQEKVGIVFSGGPAAGANAVIEMATHLLLNRHIPVLGFYRGYNYLEKLPADAFKPGTHYLEMTHQMVDGLREKGGVILKTSRANPGKLGEVEIRSEADLKDPEKTKKLRQVIEVFRQLRVGALISIGGDDTLKTAYYLSRLGMPTVHVPKTIDNDYYGIPWTFGFWTAAQKGGEDLRNYRKDAQTTDACFIIECMGRKAGWLTAGTGLHGNANLILTPEMFPGRINIDQIADRTTALILEREKAGKLYTIVVISEGLVEKLPNSQKPKEQDEHGHVKLAAAKIGDMLAKRIQIRLKEKAVYVKKALSEPEGYVTRCEDPCAYDVVLGLALGLGAFDLVAAGKFGQMVSVYNDLHQGFQIGSMPFADLIDRTTMKVRNRFIDPRGDFMRLIMAAQYPFLKDKKPL